MKRALLLVLLAGCATAPAAGSWTPLFNGRDLTGWVNVNCAPSTWTVRDGLLVCSGRPTGLLRTARRYENFVLELEWMHLKPDGNAGLFVYSDALPVCGQPFTRAVEVQVMLGDAPDGTYTGQGDIFSIWGATMEPDRPHPKGWQRCLPSGRRTKGAGEWNHYRVESRDGRLTLAVNGAVVSGASNCNPRAGYLCLESEGSEIHFRNLRLQELPSTAPASDPVDEGFVPLFNGVNLDGWKKDERHDGHWVPRDFILDYDGKSGAGDLWSDWEYGDFELIADWRFPRKPVEIERPTFGPDGNQNGTRKVADAGDSGIYLRGSSKSQVNIWCWPCGSGEVYGYRTDAAISAEVRAGVTPKVNADNPCGQWNRFRIRMKGDRLTVELNGKLVLDQARLPGVAPRGRIALQHHGDPVQFANVLVRELKD